MKIILCLLTLLLFIGSSSATTYYDPSMASYVVPAEPSGGSTLYIDGDLSASCVGGAGTSYNPTTRACDCSDGAVAYKNFSDYYVHNYKNKNYENQRVLARGGTYYDIVRLIENGYHDYPDNESERHYLAAYDPVNEPVIIDGSPSNYLGVWSVHSGSIYKSTYTTQPQNDAIRAVVIDDDFRSYERQTSLSELNESGEWFYNSTTDTIYIYTLTSKGDPTNDDVTTVADHSYGTSVITASDSPSHDQIQYFSILGIILQGGDQYGIYGDIEHLNIELVEARYNGKGGIHIRSSDSYISKNYVHGNVLRNWPRGTWSTDTNYVCSPNGGGWPFALGGSAGACNATYVGNIVSDNGGEGIGTYGHNAYNITVMNNIVNSSWSVGIYMDDFDGAHIYNNIVYDDGFNFDDVWCGCTGADWNRASIRTYMDGILTANEWYGDGFNVDNHHIYNNLIIGCGSGIGAYLVGSVDGHIRNLSVCSNTIYPLDRDPSLADGNGISSITNGIQLLYDENNTNNIIMNNIMVTGHDEQYTCYSSVTNTTSYNFSNNLYYHEGNTSAQSVWYLGGVINYINWISNVSDLNAKNVLPGLDNTSYSSTNRTEILSLIDIDIRDYYPLHNTSECVNAGIDLSIMYNTDFEGVTRPTNAVWDIGAFEYTGGASFSPSTSKSYHNLTSPIQNVVNGTGYYKWDRSVIESDNLCNFNLEVTI